MLDNSHKEGHRARALYHSLRLLLDLLTFLDSFASSHRSCGREGPRGGPFLLLRDASASAVRTRTPQYKYSH